ncbi:retroviral-like aspartic protease family protein [Novosphingobium sp.]|uniref:retroviral-like aspartic protease family protein n=1 Tax=Novosphingobium sp. TaxID=1874826 RepID=UPI0025D6FD89|nr:retroviral-like aspartic protease family protein [Novosphingobium sp.]
MPAALHPGNSAADPTKHPLPIGETRGAKTAKGVTSWSEKETAMPMNALMASIMSVAAAIPVITGQTGSQKTSDVDIVGLEKDMDGRMTVPVRVHEKGPFSFLVDTGSQNTVLSTDLAARLGIVIKTRATLVGIAGREQVDAVSVEQIDIGRRTYYGLFAPLLTHTNIGADGILGVDSLQGQRVLIDFEKRLMAIGDAKELGGNRGYEIVVTARRRSGQLIVTNAKINGILTDVVIDTGAQGSIGNRALQTAMNKRSSKSEQTILRSVTGQEIVADIGTGRKLSIGAITINNVQIAFADTPAFGALGLGDKPAILLGMRELQVFRRIAIDFEKRKILFDLPRGMNMPADGFKPLVGSNVTSAGG